MSLTLGELIDTLDAVPPHLPIKFSNGTDIGTFASWRGDYTQLTLTPGTERRTVADLLALARAADGGEFAGYKGGAFRMNLHSRVYADALHQYSERGLEGIKISDGVAVLVVGPGRREY